jgi:hypothetical protein
MSLFRCEENLSEDETQTDAQIQKKKIRLKMNRSENDPLFTGKYATPLNLLCILPRQFWSSILTFFCIYRKIKPRLKRVAKC